MRWEEFINRGIPDEESFYDGWISNWENDSYNYNYKNFYENYGCVFCGIPIGMNNRHNKFKEDEEFNILLNCSFPNVVLIDDYTTRDSEMKFHCEECNRNFIKTGLSVLEVGCPYCRESKYKGENLLARILDNHNIIYTRQDSYGCINPKTSRELYYDFIIEHNDKLIFVEIQGKQHYEPIDFFGGEDSYEGVVYRDEVKQKYAKEHGIYIAIDYREHNLKLLEERIEEQLFPLISEV